MTYPIIDDLFVRRSLAIRLAALRKTRDECVHNAAMATENLIERDVQFRLASYYRGRIAGMRAAIQIIGE